MRSTVGKTSCPVASFHKCRFFTPSPTADVARALEKAQEAPGSPGDFETKSLPFTHLLVFDVSGMWKLSVNAFRAVARRLGTGKTVAEPPLPVDSRRVSSLLGNSV